jgi:hypothetical protein
MKNLSIYFTAGCLGAFANSITVWLFGLSGITSFFDVSIAPALTSSWLYPRLVWGGIWGLLFMMPVLQSKLFLKGAILSLFPTAIQLFVVFPFKAHKGIAGIELGLYTPVFVIFFNFVWGLITALAIKYAK